MPSALDGKLVVGISSSALFDTREAETIFHKEGKAAFVQHQIAREETPLEKGTAFSLINGLLQLNPPQTLAQKKAKDEQLVEVIIFSHTEPAAGLRAMNSVDHYGLPITRAAFVGGSPLVPYLPPYQVSLFLSNNEEDVRAALASGIPAARLYAPPEVCTVDHRQLRIAFDGDAVLFHEESERIYAERGPEAFFAHEKEKAKDPMKAGPFAPFLTWLHKVRKMPLPHLGGRDPLRIALVTARNSPAHKRVILTLRAWGIEVDEIFFLGGLPKQDVLRVFAPHIFFDDQERYTQPASLVVPTGQVLAGARNPAERAITPPAISTPLVPPVPDLTLTVTVQEVPLEPLSQREFETACRAIFRSYTPLASSKASVVLDTRFRLFITQNQKKSPEERARIVRRLAAYDLSSITSHEPMLNRELESMVARKLGKISGDGGGQLDLLEIE